MKILVFGAAGFVGRNVIARLAQDKDNLLLASDNVENPFDEKIAYSQADLLDREAVFSLVKGNEVIIHLATSPLLASIQDPFLNMRINIEGTLNILDAARKNDVKRILFSSASSVIGLPQRNPVDEDHPCTPRTPYAITKRACEDYLRVYSEVYGLPYLVFRFFNVYGPWQTPKSGGLIPNLHRTLTNNDEFQVFGDGSGTRDFIYVRDIAEYYHIALRKDAKNTVLNLGTGVGTSIVQLVELASSVLGVKPRIVFKPSRPGEIGNFVADTTKLFNVLGLMSFTNLSYGLRNTFDWLQNHPD